MILYKTYRIDSVLEYTINQNKLLFNHFLSKISPPGRNTTFPLDTVYKTKSPGIFGICQPVCIRLCL